MTALIFIFCALSILGALCLLFARHPIRSAMGLLLTMVSLACLFGILEAHFIASLQIIIYAGAIMVLIVYVLMLLDVKTDSYYKRFSKVTGVGFLAALATLTLVLANFLDGGFLELPPAPDGFGNTKPIARELITTYLLAFEVSSVILLVGVIATIGLVNREPKELDS